MNKVLFVLPTDSLGGAEQLLKMIAINLPNSNIDILFLTKKRTNQWDDSPENITLKYQTSNIQYIGALVLFFNLVVKPKQTYDYIYTSHVFVTSLVGFFLKLRLLRKKYFIGRESTQIFNRYSGVRLQLYKFMYFLGYSKTDLIICQTEQMKESFVKNLPKIAQSRQVINIQNPYQEKTDYSEVENILKYGKFIVSAGRLIPEKGFDILIRVFRKLKDNYPDINLVILGEGERRQQLEDLIVELKLSESVFLTGFVSNVNSYFKQAKTCVVSSRIEGFPNVLLQMMSQNTKVVSTKCAGGIDKINGILISETESEESLFCAIDNCLKSNDDNRELFDSFLKSNSIENYIIKIYSYLKETNFNN